MRTVFAHVLSAAIAMLALHFPGTDVIGAESTLVTKARVAPRADIIERMYGSVIQGSHDGSAWVDLSDPLIPYPAANVWTDIPVTKNGSVSWEYLRWLGGVGSHGNIAELEFYNGATKILGTKFGTAGSWANPPATNDPRLEFRSAFDGDFATYFDAPIADYA
nr:hypothetical protein [Planctomycetota bacterium]